jgi:alpha-tubulin suppressor-like RCC1 family protein
MNFKNFVLVIFFNLFVFCLCAGTFPSKFQNEFLTSNPGFPWDWGYNWYGQLGNGTNNKSNTPGQVLNLTGVVAVAGGGNHSLAISTMGGVPKVVPDGSNGTEPLKVLKNNSEGSQLQIIWDDQCLPFKTNIIYGDLSQVSSYQISDSKCNISNPDIWDIGSTTNIWFIIVSDNGAGVESSWGESSFGQRNGENASGQCGNNLRDNSGTCP